MPADYTPRHRQPPPQAWDAFCDAVAVAAKMLERGAPAQPPLERLTPAQFACGKLYAAMAGLFGAMGARRPVREFLALPARAWERAAWGFSDPLLVVPRPPHAPGADPEHTMFRAAVVKLIAELVDEGAGLGAAAEAVRAGLQAQQAPQVPDVRTMEGWHRQATQQSGSHLAAMYEGLRPRPWPPTAGDTLTDRVRWIIPASRP